MQLLAMAYLVCERDKERGFTLLELIMVLVIIAILSYAGADLIVGPFRGYKETETRVTLFEEARLALEKIAAELRLAIPNAIYCPDSTTIRFGMIDYATMEQSNVFGMYKLDGDASPIDEYITDVNSSAPTGALISIYNRRWQGDFKGGARIYEVKDPGPPMRLDEQVKPGAYLKESRRFYVVSPFAVEYNLSGQTIYRRKAPLSTTGVGSFTDPHPLVRSVKGFEVHYSPGNTIRNAVVSITLKLGSDEGENVTLHSEIHIPNVP